MDEDTELSGAIVTPSVKKKADEKADAVGCDTLTMTISVSSKVWHKNKNKNVYGWKYVKRKRIICKPKSSDPVVPNKPILDVNLEGVLEDTHVAGTRNDSINSRMKS